VVKESRLGIVLVHLHSSPPRKEVVGRDEGNSPRLRSLAEPDVLNPLAIINNFKRKSKSNPFKMAKSQLFRNTNILSPHYLTTFQQILDV
jgi:hypothetical protein